MRQRQYASLLLVKLVALVFLASPTLAQDSLGDMDAAPEAAPPTSEDPTDASATTSGNDASGLLGAWRIGPTASVGFPFLLNYGVDAVWNRTYGVGFSGGRFQRDIDDKTEIEIFNWDVRARWFPWQGSFFIGAAYGNQGIVGKATKDLTTTTGDVELKIPTTVRLEIDNTYLTPHLGWFAVWDSGFTLGFELGAQIPMSSKADLQSAFENVAASTEDTLKDTDDYKKTKTDVEKAAESFGKKTVPYINLLRIGWLF